VAGIITVDDLPADVAANALAQVWLDGANAQAARVAPCLNSDDPPPTEAQLVEARLVLLGAIIRWSQAGGESDALRAAGACRPQPQETPGPRHAYRIAPTT